MTEYRVFETDQFSKDLRRLAQSGHEQVVEKLRRVVYPQLRGQPHFGSNVRKLKGYSPETWRYRIGSWRFFYEVEEDEKVVSMIAAEHRSSAYRARR